MLGIGVDIVEIDRIKESNERIVDYVLSLEEKEIYNSFSEIRRIEYLAGRFACKEAIIKCLSDFEIPKMNEIVVLNKDNGKPYVMYKNYNIEVSISHEKHYAIAFAILKEII